MKQILYIGNKLQTKNSNISSIQMLGNFLEQEHYTVYYASSKVNKIARLADMIYTFFKLVKKIDYVIIDTYSTFNFYYAIIISQLCRLFKIKYIPNLNGGNLPWRLEKYPKRCALIFKNSYCNVSPSNYLIEAFAKHGYDNVVYIPNTIEIKNYKFSVREINSIKLLWVRSFSKIYNPKLAVKVLKSLKSQNLKASLCMVGPDSDGSLTEVKNLAKKLGVEVTITGKLPKKDWIVLAEDFNIFINTTNFDNMPVSVIEAMALGLPIISTNVGGMPYLITNDHDGILVEKNNVRAMTDAIIKLKQDNSLASNLALNARKKVEAYDWQEVRRLWIKLLK